MARLGEVLKLASIAATPEMRARAKQRVREVIESFKFTDDAGNHTPTADLYLKDYYDRIVEACCRGLAEDEDLNKLIGSAVAHMTHIEEQEENLAARSALRELKSAMVGLALRVHFYERRFGVQNPLDGMEFIDDVETAIANIICMLTHCEPSVAGKCANLLLAPDGPVMIEITKWRTQAQKFESLGAAGAASLERIRLILRGIEMHQEEELHAIDWAAVYRRIQQAMVAQP